VVHLASSSVSAVSAAGEAQFVDLGCQWIDKNMVILNMRPTWFPQQETNGDFGGFTTHQQESIQFLWGQFYQPCDGEIVGGLSPLSRC